MRQVRERIALRARIAPLTKTESEDYIDHRLSLVRGEPRAVFSKQALDRIVKSANGIPRRLNILCDAVLITGFEYRQAIISDRIAKEAIAVFNGLSQPARRLHPRYAVGMLSVVLMVVFYLVYLSAMPGVTVSGPSEDTVQKKNPQSPFWEPSEQINYSHETAIQTPCRQYAWSGSSNQKRATISPQRRGWS